MWRRYAFCPNKIDNPIGIDLDPDELDLTAAEGKATY